MLLQRLLLSTLHERSEIRSRRALGVFRTLSSAIDQACAWSQPSSPAPGHLGPTRDGLIHLCAYLSQHTPAQWLEQ